MSYEVVKIETVNLHIIKRPNRSKYHAILSSGEFKYLACLKEIRGDFDKPEPYDYEKITCKKCKAQMRPE